jgi:hypothetical protein
MTPEQVQEWRAASAERLERNATRGPTTAGATHIRTLTDERDAKIVALCDFILAGPRAET